MRGFRALSTIAVTGMTAALLSAALITGGAAPAGAVTAGDDATFRAAYEDETVSVIDLTADIQMDCGEGAFHRGSAADQPLVVNGNGHTITAAGCNDQVLSNDLGDLTLNDVVITGGDYSLNGSLGGGGVQANGALTLNRSAITGNTVTSLGDNASVALGGGILGDGEVILNRSSVTGNSASCEACGGASGGGIDAPNVTLVNSTVSGNSASAESGSRGGGVRTESVTVVYSTVAGNSANEAANVYANDFLTAFGSVIAYPAGGDSCATEGTTTNGYNYDDDGTCGFGAGPGDVSEGPDPRLAALATVGLLPVHIPQTGSPLIDAIPASACSADGASTIVPLVDEVGTSRPQLSGCDIGAIEVPAPPAPEPVVIEPNFTG